MTSEPPPVRSDDELDFHVEMLTRRFISEGHDPETARQKALARMGSLADAARARTSIERQAEGRARRLSWFRAWGQDLRHAFRALRRSPGFVTLSVVMLALGTGASTAVFSVADAVILRSPFAGADAMALVHVKTPEGRLHSGVPRDAYNRLVTALAPPLVAAGQLTVGSPIVTGVDVPRRTSLECLSASMVEVVGTQPARGRWFDASDDRPGAPLAAVVSATFWERTLARDPNVLGRVITLDNIPATIIGVMPPGFEGPLSRLSRDLWLPLDAVAGAPADFGCARRDIANAAVRLAPGTTMAAGTAAVNRAAGTTDLVLTPVTAATTGTLRGPFLALVGAVVAVLLIAVANVTNLGLERLTGRRREMAVQLALGATRARLVRQTMGEHLIVAAAGAVTGTALAALTLDAVVAFLPPSFPNLAAVTLNGRVLGVSLLLTLVAGAASGLLAAGLASASIRANLTIADRTLARRTGWTRRGLVAAELALGVLLMVGALLMVRTFLTLRPSEPGFDPSGKQLALVRLPAALTLADHKRFVDGVSTGVAALPGVREVAVTTYVPMSRSVAGLDVSIEGVKGMVYTAAVTPNYFDLLRIPLQRGRGFVKEDGAAAIVNEAFVRKWLANKEPLGTTIVVDGEEPLTIVGVVRNTRSIMSDTLARPELYVPFGQLRVGSPYFVVDAEARAAAAFPQSIRAVVNGVRPGQLVDRTESYEAFLAAEAAQPRLGAWLFGSFAALAVLLAAIGLAATIAWSVAQRRREIGIRIALGARRGDVRRLILGQSLAMAAAGVTTGLLLAAWATRLLAGWLYGVTPLDPQAFVTSGAAMLVVALAAAWLPTQRASRVDPAVALRGD